MKISYVIPCYKSENTIEIVVNEIKAKMKTLLQYSYEIVLVNDCSPDATFSVIRKICKENDNVIGVNHAKNFGQHAALMAGFHLISGDIVVSLDDDGQTHANEVDKLLSKIEEGYDVVYAQYDDKKHSGFRNWGSHLNMLMTEVMLNKSKELYISSYVAMRRFIVDEILNYRGAYPYVIGLILCSTNNICNVKVKHRERMEGVSGYTLKKLISLWMNGFTSFSIIPLRLASYCGTVVAIAGFVYAVYVIYLKFSASYRVEGWSSLMSVILILGGLILLVLGLIGEYIGRVYININNSPQFVIKEVVKNGSGEEKSL